jgi:hypothetical protein
MQFFEICPAAHQLRRSQYPFPVAERIFSTGIEAVFVFAMD